MNEKKGSSKTRRPLLLRDRSCVCSEGIRLNPLVEALFESANDSSANDSEVPDYDGDGGRATLPSFDLPAGEAIPAPVSASGMYANAAPIAPVVLDLDIVGAALPQTTFLQPEIAPVQLIDALVNN